MAGAFGALSDVFVHYLSFFCGFGTFLTEKLSDAAMCYICFTYLLFNNNNNNGFV